MDKFLGVGTGTYLIDWQKVTQFFFLFTITFGYRERKFKKLVTGIYVGTGIVGTVPFLIKFFQSSKYLTYLIIGNLSNLIFFTTKFFF